MTVSSSGTSQIRQLQRPPSRESSSSPITPAPPAPARAPDFASQPPPPPLTPSTPRSLRPYADRFALVLGGSTQGRQLSGKQAGRLAGRRTARPAGRAHRLAGGCTAKQGLGLGLGGWWVRAPSLAPCACPIGQRGARTRHRRRDRCSGRSPAGGERYGGEVRKMGQGVELRCR